jgi:adenine-specific DNA-methyltransferase
LALRKELLKFLEDYSTNPSDVNRIVVSAFLQSNNVRSVKNEHINSLIISTETREVKSLKQLLDIQKISSFNDLIEIFEYVISPAEKIVTGAVYTPEHIRNYIIKKVLSHHGDLEEITACDPACGCSGFLFSLAKQLKANSSLSYSQIFRNNIYGCDIQPYSIERSKILLSLLAIIHNDDDAVFNFNLYTGNALNFEWSNYIDQFQGFDVVLGNPPYVSSRHIDTSSKMLLSKWKVCSTGHPDLYIPFFQLGTELLKDNGCLSYISMNTFFKSVNGKALRNYFQEKKLSIEIVDFGGIQVFDSKATYTCICTITNRGSEYIEYAKIENLNELGEITPKKIPYERLDVASGWNLQNIDLLTRIQKIGVPLSKRYKSRNGIATLKNSVYIFDLFMEDEVYYYFKKDQLYKVEKSICRDIINPNKLINVDTIEQIKQKIIFPYEFVDAKPSLLREEIMKFIYPFAYSYLESKKKDLDARDKGKGNYANWYAFGRNQSLEKYKFKLFFPHISNKSPKFVLNDDEDLLFYNGLAIVADNERELLFLRKLLSSRLFWFYIVNSSRHYGSEYFSISKNYFKDFGIYEFSNAEKTYIIEKLHGSALDRFIEKKYQIKLEFLSNA